MVTKQKFEVGISLIAGFDDGEFTHTMSRQFCSYRIASDPDQKCFADIISDILVAKCC